jgi:hypothetical protein
MNLLPYFEKYSKRWNLDEFPDALASEQEDYIRTAEFFLSEVAPVAKQFGESQTVILKHLMSLWPAVPITESKAAMRACSHLFLLAQTTGVHPRFWLLDAESGYFALPFLTDDGMDELLRLHPVDVVKRGTTTRKKDLLGLHIPSWLELSNKMYPAETHQIDRFSVDMMMTYVRMGNTPSYDDFIKAAKTEFIAQMLHRKSVIALTGRFLTVPG